MTEAGKQTPLPLSVYVNSYTSASRDVLIEAEGGIVKLTKREADGVVKLLFERALVNKTEKVTEVSALTTSQEIEKTKRNRQTNTEASRQWRSRPN